MAFPDLTVLDNFNRADAPTLGANWTIGTGYSALPIVSNTAGHDNIPALETWSVASFAANQRVWVTMASTLAAAGQRAWIVFRAPTTAAADGYRVELLQTGATVEAHLYRISTATEIGAAIDLSIAAFALGDFVGVDVDANLFTLYYGASGAAAVAVGTWTDSGLNAAGYLGIGYSEIGPWWLGPWPAPYNAVPPIPTAQAVAAYQPKGNGGIYYTRAVANYAASLVNLNDPGTDDAITGVAPAWAWVTGWTGDGATTYIDTTIIGGVSQDQAMLCAYTNQTIDGYVCGVADGTFAPATTLALGPRIVGGTISQYNNLALAAYSAPPLASGVLGFNGNRAFRNGLDVGMIGVFSRATVFPIYILAQNIPSLPGPFAFTDAAVVAWVKYVPSVTPAQMAAVSWAMEQIRSA